MRKLWKQLWTTLVSRVLHLPPFGLGHIPQMEVLISLDAALAMYLTLRMLQQIPAPRQFQTPDFRMNVR